MFDRSYLSVNVHEEMYRSTLTYMARCNSPLCSMNICNLDSDNVDVTALRTYIVRKRGRQICLVPRSCRPPTAAASRLGH